MKIKFLFQLIKPATQQPMVALCDVVYTVWHLRLMLLLWKNKFMPCIFEPEHRFNVVYWTLFLLGLFVSDLNCLVLYWSLFFCTQPQPFGQCHCPLIILYFLSPGFFLILSKCSFLGFLLHSSYLNFLCFSNEELLNENHC